MITLSAASMPWTWNTDLAISRPIVVTVCMLGSSKWEFQTLGYERGRNKAHAGYVAAGPIKASDETCSDRVAAGYKDDRNCRCRGFDRKRGSIAAAGNDCSHL